MTIIDPGKGWYSPQELAGLPGMPATPSAVIRAAKKNLWSSRTKVRGKGSEYELRALPDATRHHILHLALDHSTHEVALSANSISGIAAEDVKSVAIIKPGVVAVRGQVRKIKAAVVLSDAEILYRDSAVILCRAVEGAMAATDCSVKKACQELASRLVSGDARPELLAAAQVTYLKPRKDAGPLGGVSAMFQRLQRMYAFFEQGRSAGDVGMYLVPGKREKAGHNPAHVAAFLRFFCNPTRPPVSEAFRKMKPWLEERGIEIPSYSTVCRIEAELPVTVKYRGRVTGSEWRSLKTYIERDVSMFHSNDIWVGDGHSFKAKVQHPIHGQPYTPEITVILDWVSRKIVGWSVALAESTVAVSDAFRHAQMTTRARPLVYYSDNGSGQTGKMIDCPISGTLARQCIAHETGIPGNPQARGIIERIWQVTFITLARQYPTCTWRGADDNHTTKMLKLLNRKDQGGITIPTFRQLLDDVERTVAEYNLHHEHRELGGKTPEDEYQDRLDRDSIVFGPTNDEIHALWMPEVTRKPQRGLVSLFGNVYAKRDLVDLLPEGSQVRVRYDLHNPEKVWLLTMDGIYLGEAIWNGHREAAFPISEMDRLRNQRAEGKIKRGEKIIAEAQAELSDTYDMTPAVSLPVIEPDYLPQPEIKEEEKPQPEKMSHQDMVMFLWGEKDKDDGESPSSEAAAG